MARKKTIDIVPVQPVKYRVTPQGYLILNQGGTDIVFTPEQFRVMSHLMPIMNPTLKGPYEGRIETTGNTFH